MKKLLFLSALLLAVCFIGCESQESEPLPFNVSIYPNPTEGRVNVVVFNNLSGSGTMPNGARGNARRDPETSEDQEVLLVEVRLISQKKNNFHTELEVSGSNEFFLDLSDKDDGVYFLDISIDGISQRFKLWKHSND